MKTTLILSALALGLASSASFARDGSESFPQPQGAQKTRAEVRAEVLQARADGTLLVNDFQPVAAPARSSALTRAEVRAATSAAAASGELRAANRDGDHASPIAQHAGRMATSLR